MSLPLLFVFVKITHILETTSSPFNFYIFNNFSLHSFANHAGSAKLHYYIPSYVYKLLFFIAIYFAKLPHFLSNN